MYINIISLNLYRSPSTWSHDSNKRLEGARAIILIPFYDAKPETRISDLPKNIRLTDH